MPDLTLTDLIIQMMKERWLWIPSTYPPPASATLWTPSPWACAKPPLETISTIGRPRGRRLQHQFVKPRRPSRPRAEGDRHAAGLKMICQVKAFLIGDSNSNPFCPLKLSQRQRRRPSVVRRRPSSSRANCCAAAKRHFTVWPNLGEVDQGGFGWGIFIVTLFARSDMAVQ